MVASGLCTAWLNTLLGLLFGAVGSPYTAPATLYFGLATGVAADGTVAGEPSGNNYSRKSITNDTSLWDTAANGTLANKIAITFAQASGLWGTLDTAFIANHGSNGGAAVILFAPLEVEKTINTNDTPSFAIGDFDITFAAAT